MNPLPGGEDTSEGGRQNKLIQHRGSSHSTALCDMLVFAGSLQKLVRTSPLIPAFSPEEKENWSPRLWKTPALDGLDHHSSDRKA